MRSKIKDWVSANVNNGEDGSGGRDSATFLINGIYGLFDDLYDDVVKKELNNLNNVIDEQRKIIGQLSGTIVDLTDTKAKSDMEKSVAMANVFANTLKKYQ